MGDGAGWRGLGGGVETFHCSRSRGPPAAAEVTSAECPRRPLVLLTEVNADLAGRVWGTCILSACCVSNVTEDVERPAVFELTVIRVTRCFKGTKSRRCCLAGRDLGEWFWDV